MPRRDLRPRGACRSGAAAVAVAALLAGCGVSTGHLYLIDVDSGSAKDHTVDFIPPGHWDVDYSWDCSHQQQEKKAGADGAVFEVYNAADHTFAAENPHTAKQGAGGKGVLHFQRHGDYYIAVTSVCDWHITVVDLTT
jgi:hypothetical protein